MWSPIHGFANRRTKQGPAGIQHTRSVGSLLGWDDAVPGSSKVGRRFSSRVSRCACQLFGSDKVCSTGRAGNHNGRAVKTRRPSKTSLCPPTTPREVPNRQYVSRRRNGCQNIGQRQRQRHTTHTHTHMLTTPPVNLHNAARNASWPRSGRRDVPTLVDAAVSTVPRHGRGLARGRGVRRLSGG